MSEILGKDLCPSLNVWSEYLSGQVSDELMLQLSDHLETCSECLLRLSELDSDKSITTNARWTPSPYLLEDEFFRLVVWIENLSSIGAANDDLAEPVQAELPTHFGRFEVNGILGVGAFGRVYAAFDPLLQRNVAIKAPLRSNLGTDSDLANFMNEARHAAALDRDGIVPIYDVLIEESGRALIVMKRINGKSLAENRRSSPISLQRAVQLMITIAESVHFAHDRGFVHRDLKPANILIDEHGCPWVTDFGLGLCLTATNSPFDVCGGTPQYMSPEQVRRDIPAIDRRSDIWALGIMLAELVHGCKPFPQSERKELFHAITSAEPAIVSSRETAELNEIIRKCLAKRPDDRIATAKALADRLSKWSARHYPTGLAKWKYGWRRIALFIAACAIAGLSVRWGWRTSSEEREQTLNQLEYASPEQVADVIQRLRSTGINSERLAKSDWGTHANWKIDVTLIALGDLNPSTVSRVCDALELADHARWSAILAAIDDAGRSSSLVIPISERLSKAAEGDDKRLRLAAALARIAPDSTILEKITDEVARILATLSPSDRHQWLQCFSVSERPLFADALARLAASDAATHALQSGATECLAEMHQVPCEQLLQVAMRLNSSLMPRLMVGLQHHKEAAIEKLTAEFVQCRRIVLESQSEFQASDAELKGARLAILLWLLGDTSAVCSAITHQPNPTLQTLVIHGLAEQRVNPEPLLRLIQTRANDYDQESSAIKMGFLQILAQMPPTNMESVGAAKTLNSLWQNDQDAGVHSSTKLLAKRLGISLHPLEVGQKGNWLVDQFEQEFAIVGSEGELGIHDIDKALPLTIPWLRHTRKFRHKFAIAMNELSIEQFRKYFPAYQADNSLLQESAGDAAMVHCTLQAAYQFCNALSVQANLPTCYELSEDDDSYLVPKPQHLKLTGYRLPTDGEWELACRAGSTTARYFGNADHLTDQYGWVGDNFSRAAIENHMVLPQTTAALLPNRWGLFDCYGNALEMCDESLDPEPVGCTYDDITCLPAFPRHMSPVIRGSSIMYPKEYAQSHCRSKQLFGLENTWFGFRLARTLPE